MAPSDLTASLGPLELRSPLIAASGTVGSVWEWVDVADPSPYGAAVAKSVAPVAWPGRPAPRLAPVSTGMLNGIGIQNAGIEAWVDDMRRRIPELGVPVWGSAVAGDPVGFGVVSKGLEAAGVSAVEVNLSCPNLEDGRMFSLDPIASGRVVEVVRAEVGLPIGAKLSPETPDIVGVARGCQEAGADFVVLTNTVRGFGVDVEGASPSLSGGVGGYSGPGIKPIALRCVFEVASAVPGLPIVGCGGVMTGRDVAEYLMAGASAVAIGTAHFADPSAGLRIGRELVRVMGELKVESVRELVGALHR